MIVTIRGKRWTVKRRKIKDCIGLCDAPSTVNKAISVDPKIRDEVELEVFIHEMIHAAHWDLAEDAVAETAADIARALWRLGYRKGE